VSRLPSSEDFDVYATLAAAAAGQTSAVKMTSEIYCHTAGVLVVKKPGGSTVALNFLAGTTKRVRATAIIESGSSGCIPVEVFR
jgi:hypothetical protein